MLWLIGILGTATVMGLTASVVWRDIKQEERRKKCLELVEKGKVAPSYCTEYDKKGLIEDIRKTIDDAGKLALTGGFLYLLARLTPQGGKNA
ncbi:MAG: hypothetical protein GXN96_01395 [Aquificae bacterium]|nr:hypothetical protein [Aquificota bacterium]